MLQKINIQNIVADPKVFRKGIDRYKEKILKNEKIKPIRVLKHPKKDLYAVLDGHHRFYAFLEAGITEIECSVIKAPTFLFDGTAKGWLQPHPAITKNVRIPMKRFTNYMIQFRKYPEKLLKVSRKPLIRFRPYSAQFIFDDKIAIKKRKELIKWSNSSIKKMKIVKDIDAVEIKINNSLEDTDCSFDKVSKKVVFSIPESVLNKLDKKLLFHYIGHINEIIKGFETEKTKQQPEVIQNAAQEIVAMSVDGSLEEKNLPHISKEERKNSFYKKFREKYKFKINRERLNKIVNRFWGKKLKTEKEVIKKAEEVVESLEKKAEEAAPQK